MVHPLMALSSVDGRYAAATAPLRDHLSEFALIKRRVYVKIEYIKQLAGLEGTPVRALTEEETDFLTQLHIMFSLEDAEKIQRIERTGYEEGDVKIARTNHDVQAVEEWLRLKLRYTSMRDLLPWLHFARTSEDINSVAYALMLSDAFGTVMLPAIDKLLLNLEKLSVTYSNLPMLARTHGQPASPTTFGKEVRVFYERLKRERDKMGMLSIDAKFSGATGNHNAAVVALPNVDWVKFAERFIDDFNGRLEGDDDIRLHVRCNHVTTQIEPHDSYAELFHSLCRINTILGGLAKDWWRYVSDGWLVQKAAAGEVGSTAMPHKVNPIDMENAEGNLGVANALLLHFAQKLAESRLQRDLSDSTVIRNFGTALALALVGYTALLRGLDKTSPDKEAMHRALVRHPEVLAEAMQVILRREGVEEAYSLLKDIARGKPITMDDFTAFIDALSVSDSVKEELRALRPWTYIGIAPQIARGEV